MAAISWDDVVAHASALADMDPDAQADILEYVNNTLNVSKFGGENNGRTKLARIYLAAHFGTTINSSMGGGASGPVKAESVGDVRREYATAVSTSSISFESTVYGQSYLDLVKTSAARGPLVL